MDKLAPEILYSIFIQLDLKQRLVCLTVCNRWWSVLDKGALFHSFIITSDYQFRRLMNAFERLPDYATHVEEISINHLTDSGFINRNIFDTFPNVRKINAQKYTSVQSERFPYIKKYNDIVYSKPKLEYLSDIGACILVSQMLSLNLGSRLETLNLDFGFSPHCRNVVTQLKDLPVLKSVYIRKINITVVDLENVHHNIPSIQNFALIESSILAGSTPSNVVPAISITTLKFKSPYYADKETCAHIYQYMIKKYTNLSNIEYRDEVFRVNARNKFNHSQRKYVYLNGVLDFYKIIGSKQNKLFLYELPDDIDVFAALDAGNAKLESAYIFKCESKTLFPRLAQSKQSDYIQELFITNTPIASIIPFENMAALTKLSIDCTLYPGGIIHLEECLAGCPSTLKSLTIRKSVIVPASFTKKLISVEYLNLDVAEITGSLGEIISNCFPNLADLRLSGTVKGNRHIALKNSHFQAADVQIHGIGGDKSLIYGFAFKSANIAETRYYMCSYQKASQVNYADVNDLPYLSVECFTEKKVETRKQDLRPFTTMELCSLKQGAFKLRLY